MYSYSIIIPVYNRPEDIHQMLLDLSNQTFKDFEVLVIESGSAIKSDQVVQEFEAILNIRYFYKSNEGQGYSRNYGMARAQGKYFIILDSDLMLDSGYLEAVHAGITKNGLDAFGGPDRAHPSFTPTQKAVDFILTSFLTTGGMRGGKKAKVKFYPRSFNMGFSREVYQKTGGFALPFFGEDIELSARIMQSGYKVGLIQDAYVYHKRKNTFSGFWKQMFFFGRARINISHLIPGSLRLVHAIPALFLLGLFTLVIAYFILPGLAILGTLLLLCYIFAIFVSAYVKHKSMIVALFTLPALFIQMVGYGSGFIKQWVTHTLTGKGVEKFKPQKDI